MKPRVYYFFELLSSMTEKELRARYKQTIFGFLWIFINPLIQMLVIGFVFPLFIKRPISNYNIFLFTGLLVWNFFSLSLSKATSSIVNERSLIKKSQFPRITIPISIIMANGINLFTSFLILIPFAIYLQTFSYFEVGYLLLGVLYLLCFTIGLCLCTSALNVRFRDVSFFVQALLVIWFYLSPIIYSLTLIPSHLVWIWWLNPMTATLQFFQCVFAHTAAPDMITTMVNGVIILIVLGVGIFLFEHESKNFDDWI